MHTLSLEILLLAAAILASLCASAFFSGSETGLLAISRERIVHLVRKAPPLPRDNAHYLASNIVTGESGASDGADGFDMR